MRFGLRTAIGIGVGLVGIVGAYAIGTWIEGTRGIGTADNAEWVELPEGPAVLVSGMRSVSPEDGPSYDVYAWVVVDAASGETRSGGYRMGTTQTWRGSGGPTLLAAGGTHALYRGEDGLVLHDLTTQDEASGKALEAMFPEVAAPWFEVRVTGPGRVVVEADDKRWWDLDLATVGATAADPPAGPHYQACVAPVWRHAGGEWRFVEVETERHSDRRAWALASVKAVEDPRPEDPDPLDLRVEYGFFACDERTGSVATFADGSVLVGTWRTDADTTWLDVGQLDETGKIAWSVPSGVRTRSYQDVEAFGHAGGFVVRVDSRLLSVDASGTIRWQRDL